MTTAWRCCLLVPHQPEGCLQRCKVLESRPSSPLLALRRSFSIKPAAGPHKRSKHCEYAAVEFSAVNGSPVSPPPRLREYHRRGSRMDGKVRERDRVCGPAAFQTGQPARLHSPHPDDLRRTCSRLVPPAFHHCGKRAPEVPYLLEDLYSVKSCWEEGTGEKERKKERQTWKEEDTKAEGRLWKRKGSAGAGGDKGR